MGRGWVHRGWLTPDLKRLFFLFLKPFLFISSNLAPTAMDSFAGSVMLGDLNDFIAPSQSCVNPLFAVPSSSSSASSSASSTSASGSTATPGDGTVAPDDPRDPRGVAKISLSSGIFSGIAEPNLIKASATKTAKVSLNDCLACSGCVTSAETVLIEAQSSGRFREAVASGTFKHVVLTVSAQSRASLADDLGVSCAAVVARLQAFFARQGVDCVLDAAFGTDLALLEARAEFVSRFRRKQLQERQSVESPGGGGGGGVGAAVVVGGGKRPQQRPKPQWVRPPNTKAVSSRRVVDPETGEPATPVASKCTNRIRTVPLPSYPVRRLPNVRAPPRPLFCCVCCCTPKPDTKPSHGACWHGWSHGTNLQ